MTKKVEAVRTGLRKFNRWAGVLNPDPYNLGLSLSQASALVDLERFGSLRPAMLAMLLKLDRSSVSRLISKLSNDGLISIKGSDHDRRVKDIRLTAKGAKALHKINKASNDSVIQVFKFLSNDDRDEIVQAFGKLAAAVELAEKKPDQ